MTECSPEWPCEPNDYICKNHRYEKERIMPDLEIVEVAAILHEFTADRVVDIKLDQDLNITISIEPTNYAEDKEEIEVDNSGDSYNFFASARPGGKSAAWRNAEGGIPLEELRLQSKLLAARNALRAVRVDNSYWYLHSKTKVAVSDTLKELEK